MLPTTLVYLRRRFYLNHHYYNHHHHHHHHLNLFSRLLFVICHNKETTRTSAKITTFFFHLARWGSSCCNKKEYSKRASFNCSLEVNPIFSLFFLCFVTSSLAKHEKKKGKKRYKKIVPGRPFFILRCVIRPTPYHVSPTNNFFFTFRVYLFFFFYLPFHTFSLFFFRTLSLSLPFFHFLSFLLRVSHVQAYILFFSLPFNIIRLFAHRVSHACSFMHTQQNHWLPRKIHVYACTSIPGYIISDNIILHLYPFLR